MVKGPALPVPESEANDLNAVMDSPCTTLTRTSGAVSGVRRVSAMHKQIAVDLAKSVYQVVFFELFPFLLHL